MSGNFFRGSKTSLISIAALALITIVGLTVAVLQPREPAYQGKTLSDWLKTFDGSDWTIAPDPESPAVQAIRQIGTNALPTLLEMASTSDNWLKVRARRLCQKQSLIVVPFTDERTMHMRAAFGYKALGTRAVSVIPELTFLLNKEQFAVTAAISLAGLGPEGVPPLISALTHTNSDVRQSAAAALAIADSDPNTITRALVAAMSDPVLAVRANSAFALGHRRELPELAVPALAKNLRIRCEDDGTSSSMAVAYWALGEFGAKAREAVPQLAELLRSTNAFERNYASKTLKQIEPPPSLSGD